MVRRFHVGNLVRAISVNGVFASVLISVYMSDGRQVSAGTSGRAGFRTDFDERDVVLPTIAFLRASSATSEGNDELPSATLKSAWVCRVKTAAFPC